MTKIALCGALMGAISLSAQDSTVAEKNLIDTITQVTREMVSSATPVKGAPYSAQAVNETVRVLADGNRITNSNSQTLYRDSQGRERREQSSGGAVRSILISDPVEGVSYTLEPESKVAHKSPRVFSFTAGGRGGGGGAVTVGVGTYTFTTSSSSTTGGRFEVEGGQVNPLSKEVQEKEEKLPSQTIEGVFAEGTRTTMTLPAGSIGNEQPLVTVNERWYSPELKVLVMSTRSDPRSGTTTYKLINISRSEPAATLFQVPPDYTVKSQERGTPGVLIQGKPEEE
jgi:hypothetical protein